jgi:hypothetical protein
MCPACVSSPSPPLEERAGERRPFVNISLLQHTNDEGVFWEQQARPTEQTRNSYRPEPPQFSIDRVQAASLFSAAWLSLY